MNCTGEILLNYYKREVEIVFKKMEYINENRKELPVLVISFVS